MNTRLLVRIAASTLVVLAILVSVIELRRESTGAPASSKEEAAVSRNALSIRTRACAAMGEAALSDRACLAAWAEQRRRFLATMPRAGTAPSGGTASRARGHNQPKVGK